MKVYIGADHRGFQLKEVIKSLLTKKQIPYEDLGNLVFDQQDDYPEFAEKVALKVSKQKGSVGIVVCGSGVGVDVVANKVDGVRSALVTSPEQLRQAREDDDVNVLAFAADFVKQEEIPALLDAFISTEYDPTPSHMRRLEEVKKIEHEA